MKHKTAEQQASATIFVQIASYRDTECQWTVKDLFEKASNPSRIFVGICQQNDAELDKDCFLEPYPFPNQVREAHFEAKHSKGVCWARHEAQKLYEGEDYVLMIDSHMRFVEGWDEKILHELSLCESDKAILTAYPPGYTPPNNLTENALPAVSRVKQNNPGEDIRGEGMNLANPPEKPIRGAFWSAGFLFAPAKLIQEVPYDPYMYFNQEEISLAVRAFTFGWDIYHPVHIFVYHNYIRLDEKERPLHWEDHSDWLEWQHRGMNRLFHLVGHKKTTDPHVLQGFDKYGLGFQRTLDEFSEFSGIDFVNWRPTQRARRAEFIPNLATYQIAPPGAPSSHAQPKATAAASAESSNLLAPLSAGHYLPRFVMQNEANSAVAVENIANGNLILVMLPISARKQAAQLAATFQQLSQRWNFQETRLALITEQKPESYIPLLQEHQLALPLLHDAGGALGKAFEGNSRFNKSAYAALVDKNLKIHAVEPFENIEQLFSLADDLKLQVSSTSPAPIAKVPLALNSSLADQLSEVDVGFIEDSLLETMLDDYFSKSILPEMNKAFGFDATHREKYQLRQITPAAEGDKASLYRDTSSASAKHRVMSALILLPSQYQGNLSFTLPEYGEQSYELFSSEALLLSSAQLYTLANNSAQELTLLQAFFYDEQGENKRLQYLGSQGVEKIHDDHRLLDGRIFPGLNIQ